VFPGLSLQFNSLKNILTSRHILGDDVAPVEEDIFEFDGTSSLPHLETNHSDDLTPDDSAASCSGMATTVDPSWHHPAREGLQLDVEIPDSAMPEVRVPVHFELVTGCLWPESPYPSSTLSGENFPGEPPPSSINEAAASPGVNPGSERESTPTYDHVYQLSVASTPMYSEESPSSRSDEEAGLPGSSPSSEKASDPMYDHVDELFVALQPSLSSLDSSWIEEALEERGVDAPVTPRHSSPKSFSIDHG
jgi:hypothetical protein